MLSIPGLQRLFLCQCPCLNALLPPDARLQILHWTTGVFVLGPSLICHIMSLLISGSNFTYTLLGHFPDCPIYLPRILSSKICVSVLKFWSSSFFWNEKDTYFIFCNLSASSSSLPFPPNKRYFSIWKLASESYEQNNLFSPSIILRKAWNILMQRFSWRQKLAGKNSSQTARVWLSYK